MSASLAKNIIKLSLFNFKAKTPLVRLDSSFQSAVLKDAGKPLTIGKVNPPKELNQSDVKIKVHYCSVNSVDCASFRDSSRKLPFVPGYELAGEVISVGKSITKEQCMIGERVAALSLNNFGGFAEHCVVDINDVWRVPSNVELKDAAVLICGHSTAIFAFSTVCKLKERDNILVTAGSAGLGLAAVDVAANIYKAKVIGVTDTEDRAALLRERGAFHAFRFNKKIQKEVFSFTKKNGVDILYDSVGENMETLGSCISTGGKILCAAPFSYKTVPAPPPNSYLTLVSLHALRVQNLQLYRTVVSDTLELADEGVISAHVSAKFELKDVNDAIAYIEDKKCTGKVVIEIAN